MILTRYLPRDAERQEVRADRDDLGHQSDAGVAAAARQPPAGPRGLLDGPDNPSGDV